MLLFFRSASLVYENAVKSIWHRRKTSICLYAVFVFSFILYALHSSCDCSCVYYILRTWLTEPGILRKRNEEEEEIPEPTDRCPRAFSSRVVQRKIASLMACVRNDKTELLSVRVAPSRHSLESHSAGSEHGQRNEHRRTHHPPQRRAAQQTVRTCVALRST